MLQEEAGLAGGQGVGVAVLPGERSAERPPGVGVAEPAALGVESGAVSSVAAQSLHLQQRKEKIMRGACEIHSNSNFTPHPGNNLDHPLKFFQANSKFAGVPFKIFSTPCITVTEGLTGLSPGGSGRVVLLSALAEDGVARVKPL